MVPVIEIDGSAHSGSGTLLRYSAALAALLARPLRMTRIRAKREKPGLRPQHLQAVRACSSFSGGEISGDQLGSGEIFFRPGHSLPGGDFQWDMGTAGSTTLLAFALIPLALFARGPSRFLLTGGLFQDFAPSAFHLREVLLPLLGRMGADVRVEILRPGYPPKGQGRLQVEVRPLQGPLRPLEMKDPGPVREIRGISLASHLESERVAERMAEECRALLAGQGPPLRMEVVRDRDAVQKGAALALWAKTEAGCLLGADQAGAPGRRAEAIARSVVGRLLEDLQTEAAADRHLADQLILFAALARGTTRYSVPRVSGHVLSNLWLAETILGVKTRVEGNRVAIEGMGFQRAG